MLEFFQIKLKLIKTKTCMISSEEKESGTSSHLNKMKVIFRSLLQVLLGMLGDRVPKGSSGQGRVENIESVSLRI